LFKKYALADGLVRSVSLSLMKCNYSHYTDDPDMNSTSRNC